MPVSLDKTPAPKPEDMDRAPAYRVELRKLTAPYIVVADTTGQWTRQTPENWIDVLSVERAATHDVERALQRLDIEAGCDDAPNLSIVELYAVSAGDAALKAHRQLTDALYEDLMLSLIRMPEDG
ncbi:hypothetical protein OG345_42090 (plasmid) [Streptomyces sp. NBC_01220]|uniref:hypothetical protein n=1 Tax=Streptomyces sp. NBC_01220 TaxID=2903781 RepID=UPI00352F092D|nr:hypothetical protein OG345_42090 [Streptomyces sp. NBC_01220]